MSLPSPKVKYQKRKPKIAVLSDIHDNIWNLEAAKPGLLESDVMICCGDLCSLFIVGMLADGYGRVLWKNADRFKISCTAMPAIFGS